MNRSAFLYKLLRPFLSGLFMAYYNPTIINSEVIPAEGRCVIAGNHKHALEAGEELCVSIRELLGVKYMILDESDHCDYQRQFQSGSW